MAKTQTKTKTKKTETTKQKAAENTQTAKTTGAKLPQYFYGLGRRKTASATVRLFDTKGVSTVNEVAVDEAFIHDYEMQVIMAPFEAAELDPSSFHFTTKVKGSGPKAQIDAIQLGIARAIVKMDPSLKTKLKAKGLMTRDPRAVERKKPGLRKARRAEQFSKR